MELLIRPRLQTATCIFPLPRSPTRGSHSPKCPHANPNYVGITSLSGARACRLLIQYISHNCRQSPASRVRGTVYLAILLRRASIVVLPYTFPLGTGATLLILIPSIKNLGGLTARIHDLKHPPLTLYCDLPETWFSWYARSQSAGAASMPSQISYSPILSAWCGFSRCSYYLPKLCR
jgi:hypothetical protein